MLILTRRVTESTELKDTRNDDVIANVTILDVRGGKVRMGWEADKHVQILRDNALQVQHGRTYAKTERRLMVPRDLLMSVVFGDPMSNDSERALTGLRDLLSKEMSNAAHKEKASGKNT